MVERRLAAILIADVVGYSQLLERDESATLAALQAYTRDIQPPLVRKHQGRVVKSMGDGVLIEFSSAVNAVQCAVELQQEMAAAGRAEPGSARITLRIGLSLGDVVVDGSDIFGDGVNIAARLEPLAEPGGICISESVYRQVKGKVSVQFEDMGEQTLKNMSESVRCYRFAPQTSVPSALHRTSPNKPSIAVLPFANMSGDAEQSYFCDGMTEDIITELSKFRELEVIARNSSFQFRDKATDMRAIADKLGVLFVVEGSIRKIDNRIRVTAQLIDARSSAHIWAERYDREMTDVFLVQDEITRSIVVRVAGLSQNVLAKRARAQPTSSLTAYDYYLRGRELFINYDTGLQCLPYLEKATELDPNFAIAHALISDTCCFQYQFTGQQQSLDRALSASRLALDLDPREPWAHCAHGLVLKWLGQLGEARHHVETALSLNPNDAYMLAVYASLLSLLDLHDEALKAIDEALRRDPYAYDWFWDERAMVLAASGNYRSAIESRKKMKAPETAPPLSHCFQAICHIELGQIQEATAALARFRNIANGQEPMALFAAEPFANPETVRRLTASLERAIAAGA